MPVSQCALFEVETPALLDLTTEGVKYAGSKAKLLPNILGSVAGLPIASVLDVFSGTTRVSQAFAKNGYRVVSNDHAVWSETFGTAYLKNDREPSSFLDLIDHLNHVDPVDGWFTQTYGGADHNGSARQTDGQKGLWQLHNTRKLDGIRGEIDRLELDPLEKAIALTSLILALDKVENTLGHFVAYLKDWSPRSFNTLTLRVPATWKTESEHIVTREDAFNVIPRYKCDLTYLDPPYGSNNEKMPPSRVRYASYYHIWKTVCLNDQPEVFGAARRRTDTSDKVATSIFEEFRRDEKGNFVAVEAIRRLLREARSPYVMLSYSSGGLATAEQLDSALRECGMVLRTVRVAHRRNVMAEMKWTHEWLRDVSEENAEFIFLIAKE